MIKQKPSIWVRFVFTGTFWRKLYQIIIKITSNSCCLVCFMRAHNRFGGMWDLAYFEVEIPDAN